MTIEATLEHIAVSLEKIARHLTQPVATQAAPTVKPVVVEAPAPIVPPVPQEVIPPTPPVPQAAPITAGLPLSEATPVAPVTPSDCPIIDAASLMNFVMSAYKDMGPAKGAKIQEVLTGIGIKAINEAQPQHYAAIYAGVEALKAA